MVLPSTGNAGTKSESSTSGSGQDNPVRPLSLPALATPSVESHPGSRQSTLTSPTKTHVNDVLKHLPLATRRPRWGLPAWFASRNSNRPDNPSPVDHPSDIDIDPGPFAFRPHQLATLVDSKDIGALHTLGGVEGLLRGLGTYTDGLVGDADNPPFTEPAAPDKPSHDTIVEHPGTSGSVSPVSQAGAYAASLADRARVYGVNKLPVRESKSIWQLMWDAYTEKVLILLSIAAVVSLALGLFQDFGPGHEADEPRVEWVEGVAIMVAIVVVVLVGSLTDWQKERQFRVLSAKKDERAVKVVRGGVERRIGVHEVLVGDVALLEPGEVIPCDGVFLRGHNVRCDESGATGESDVIKKAEYATCWEMRQSKLRELDDEASVNDVSIGHTDCFLISGSKVLEGVGSYVVVAVGQRSFHGRIMSALRDEVEDTTLQRKLNHLANYIAVAGSIGGALLFIGLIIRFLVKIGTGVPAMSSGQKGLMFVDILILSFTLVVASVPEGLPLAIALALAFATKRMTRENLLVRVLNSCETMANASVICTDKTGTLTQNEMTVVAGSIGSELIFVRDIEQHPDRALVHDPDGLDKPSSSHHDHVAVELNELNNALSPALCGLINDAVSINSTAFEDTDATTGAPVFVGSKTETALLSMARDLGWRNYKSVREESETLQVFPFSSERKAMGVVVRLPDGRARLYVKGASEILTAACVRQVVTHTNADGDETVAISDSARATILTMITSYASQTLRTIAITYRDFDFWPPREESSSDEITYDELAREMTLVGIFALEDPLRPGVREAVADCACAGVQVKMCTGDNALTARSIAHQCGIFTKDGIVMEGPHFRALSDAERRAAVPRLQVLARSSPEDKRILVNTLKELGEIVGVTGDGTNDGPALKAAHVGFSMGVTGTEVAKEASDIVLMDDNFASIVKAIMWGRTVNDAVRKFLQFQVTPTFTAVVVTLVSALASDDFENSVLSAVQLLWVAIIIDTFAALALATDPATPAVLARAPERKDAPLFTVDMLKQILGQSAYQVAIVLAFHFCGDRILGFPRNDLRNDTLVFNVFVFAQIFNSFNCRRLDRQFNIFEGIHKNPYFISITFIEIAVQILIIFVGGDVFAVTRLGVREWGISLALSFVSIPLGALIRMMPNGPCERAFKLLHLYREPAVLPIAQPGLDFARRKLEDDVGAFKRIRGGRLRARGRSSNTSVVSNVFAMLPTLVGAHIAGPTGQGEDNGSRARV